MRHGKNTLVGCSKTLCLGFNMANTLTFTSLILRDLRGVAGGDGKLGTSRVCDGSAHPSGCVVNGYGCNE